MIGYAYTPLFGTALTPQGSVEALAFVIDRSSPSFAELSDAEAAAIIATGRGELGTNLEYFDNLAEHVAGLESRITCSKRYDLSYIAPNVPSVYIAAPIEPRRHLALFPKPAYFGLFRC